MVITLRYSLKEKTVKANFQKLLFVEVKGIGKTCRKRTVGTLSTHLEEENNITKFSVQRFTIFIRLF